MKKIACLLLLIGFVSNAQGKYLTKAGTIAFEASVPSFEEVAAKNTTVTAIINSANGEFASLVLVKGFRFKNALMEEHFNENYAESSEYPKAMFKGTIISLSTENLNGEHTINGSLTFHGVTKTLENIPVTLKNEADTIIMNGEFVVSPADFNIKIPKIVQNKVSQAVRVKFNFNLIKKD